MKRVANTRKPPIVIPVIVIAIDIQVTLAIVAVEGSNCAKYLLYHHLSNALKIEYYSAS